MDMMKLVMRNHSTINKYHHSIQAAVLHIMFCGAGCTKI